MHSSRAMCQTTFSGSAQLGQSPMVFQQLEQAIIPKTLRTSWLNRDSTIAMTDRGRSNLPEWISQDEMTHKPRGPTFIRDVRKLLYQLRTIVLRSSMFTRETAGANAWQSSQSGDF